jgi:putative hydrolase of the HAD superfamily
LPSAGSEDGDGIAVVLFDLGGVLFRYDPAVRWRAFAALTGLSEVEVRRRLSASGWARACDQGRYRGQAAVEAGLSALGARLSRERFTEAWMSAFAPDDAALDIGRAVQARTPSAVFSNNSDLVREGLEARWPSALASFRPRIFSADLGLTKPDPKAYLAAARILEQSPEAILVIDDAPVNTATAASLGFPTLLYRDPSCLADELGRLGLL